MDSMEPIDPRPTPIGTVPFVVEISPADPSAPRAELTADLWRLIMTYMGQAHLVHGARRVCKAWRSFADHALQRGPPSVSAVLSARAYACLCLAFAFVCVL